MKTISACIICKNEEPVLDKMFNSIKSVVDEIIFVDTGSTDKSKDIAAKYGAKIYDFPWTGSFSDARNEAMKHATKDFIFQIDCDETLTSQSVAELQRLKNCDLKLYNVTMHNFLDTGDMVVSNNFRLFPNDKELVYELPIHENVSDYKNKYKIDGTSIILDHYGYTKSEKDRKGSDKRNYDMLKECVDKEPNNPYFIYHFAQQCFLAKKYEDAYKFYMQVVDILKADPKHFYANYLPLSYDGAAVCATTINDINKINALKDVETTSSAFYLNLGTFCENANLLDAAITLYDKACYCTKLIGKLLSYDNGAMTWKPYASLGNAYFKAGKISKAIDAYRLALSENQVLPEIWAQASRLYIALENIPMAETYMKEAIKHKNDKVNNIALANIYIASERLKPGVELYFKWASPEQLIALMQEMHRNGFTDIVDDIQHVLDSREHAFTMPNVDMPLLENSVTIIMPTLLVAPARWIERSLEEAEKCKYIKKVIVIDNTAKKEFKSKIKFGNKVMVVDDQPDLQVNPAWNYGVNLCDTKYYLLLNDDILWNSDVIQSCLNVVEKNDRYSVLTVVTRRESFDEYNKGFPVTTPKIITAAVPLNHIEGGWFVFGKKDEWINIPSELKIFYGDNFIFENAVIKHKKKIGKILTQYICHIVSITVTSLHLYEEGLLQTEGKIYEKIRAKIR